MDISLERLWEIFLHCRLLIRVQDNEVHEKLRRLPTKSRAPSVFEIQCLDWCVKGVFPVYTLFTSWPFLDGDSANLVMVSELFPRPSSPICHQTTTKFGGNRLRDTRNGAILCILGSFLPFRTHTKAWGSLLWPDKPSLFPLGRPRNLTRNILTMLGLLVRFLLGFLPTHRYLNLWVCWYSSERLNENAKIFFYFLLTFTRHT